MDPRSAPHRAGTVVAAQPPAAKARPLPCVTSPSVQTTTRFAANPRVPFPTRFGEDDPLSSYTDKDPCCSSTKCKCFERTFHDWRTSRPVYL